VDSETLGSWIIILTFALAFIYLIKERPDFSPLGLAAKFSTAILLCFAGLLFTGVVSYLAQLLQIPLSGKLVLGLLVPVGTLLSALIRHQWRRRFK